MLWIVHSDFMLCCGSITRNDNLCCGSFAPLLCCVVDRSLGVIYCVVDRSLRLFDMFNFVNIYIYICSPLNVMFLLFVVVVS